ncbi:MAG: CoA pyrophosphatase [Bacteroidia bacterium]|nr:CoA pyrophosphatase [Bacteroidia bacterium]
MIHLPAPDVLIPALRDRLSQPLPGWAAQEAMTPAIRLQITTIPADAKRSAVMLLLYLRGAHWYFALMRRPANGRVHGGQLSLPGGRHEPSDPDFTWTALRETHEEFGLDPAGVEVLGALTEVYIPPSNFMVYPRIGYLPAAPVFTPDPNEVAEIIEIELAHLLEDNLAGTHLVEMLPGRMIEAPGYLLKGQHLIWGGTAIMLAEFRALLREVVFAD